MFQLRRLTRNFRRFLPSHVPPRPKPQKINHTNHILKQSAVLLHDNVLPGNKRSITARLFTKQEQQQGQRGPDPFTRRKNGKEHEKPRGPAFSPGKKKNIKQHLKVQNQKKQTDRHTTKISGKNHVTSSSRLKHLFAAEDRAEPFPSLSPSLAAGVPELGELVEVAAGGERFGSRKGGFEKAFLLIAFLVIFYFGLKGTFGGLLYFFLGLKKQIQALM